jgi:hypothetical protein
VWETASPEYGACRWLAIASVTTGEPEAWHRDFNVALQEETVTIGFLADEAYEGEGVLVGSLPEGDSAARGMRLAPGDVIVAAGDLPVRTMDDVYEYKRTLRRGGPVSLTVMRGERRLILEGRLPESGTYNCFKRELPSALARVSFSANRVDVQASRLGAFRVLVHPEMFDLGENVVVTVNGKVVRDAPVTPDVGFLLRNFLENRDRRLLYVAEIPVTLE